MVLRPLVHSHAPTHRHNLNLHSRPGAFSLSASLPNTTKPHRVYSPKHIVVIVHHQDLGWLNGAEATASKATLSAPYLTHTYIQHPTPTTNSVADTRLPSPIAHCVLPRPLRDPLRLTQSSTAVSLACVTGLHWRWPARAATRCCSDPRAGRASSRPRAAMGGTSLPARRCPRVVAGLRRVRLVSVCMSGCDPSVGFLISERVA